MAEVRLTEPGIALYGAIRSFADSTLTVELLTLPRSPGIVRRGAEAEVYYSHSGTIYSSVTSVQNLTDATLELAILHAARPAPRRTIGRVKCDMPVQYRAIRPDGRNGAWMECAADDISSGGIGLLFPGGVEIPRRLEMLFFLPIVTATPTDLGRLAVTESLAVADPSPVKSVGRVVHCRPSTYGRIRAGAAFSVISPSDRDRVARFGERVSLQTA